MLIWLVCLHFKSVHSPVTLSNLSPLESIRGIPEEREEYTTGCVRDVSRDSNSLVSLYVQTGKWWRILRWSCPPEVTENVYYQLRKRELKIRLMNEGPRACCFMNRELRKEQGKEKNIYFYFLPRPFLLAIHRQGRIAEERGCVLVGEVGSSRTTLYIHLRRSFFPQACTWALPARLEKFKKIWTPVFITRGPVANSRAMFACRPAAICKVSSILNEQ